MLLRSCLRARAGLGLRLVQPVRMGHDHGPLMPPFARSGPPTSKVSRYRFKLFIAFIFLQELFADILFLPLVAGRNRINVG